MLVAVAAQLPVVDLAPTWPVVAELLSTAGQLHIAVRLNNVLLNVKQVRNGRPLDSRPVPP